MLLFATVTADEVDSKERVVAFKERVVAFAKDYEAMKQAHGEEHTKTIDARQNFAIVKYMWLKAGHESEEEGGLADLIKNELIRADQSNKKLKMCGHRTQDTGG